MTKDLMKNTIIAPMATAIWLIDNTSLSFKQIGDFCDFTEAEVQLIADGVIGKGIFPVDPTKNGNLTKEEIFAREQDGNELKNAFSALSDIDVNIQKQKKYIPMLQRRSRPEAILWLINYCPNLTDAQIIKLVRTTKNMVKSIRDKSYAEYNDLVAKDPVILGFCSQRNLDKEISIAKEKIEKQEEKEKKLAEKKERKAIRKINVNKVKVPKQKKDKKDKPKKVKKIKKIKKIKTTIKKIDKIKNKKDKKIEKKVKPKEKKTTKTEKKKVIKKKAKKK